MARDFVTSRPSACGERFMLCQNKTLSNGLVKTSERANRHPHKPANLFAKKWNTSARENMARVRRSKPLRLACPRRDVPAWTCPRRGAAGNERKDRPDATLPKAGAARPDGHRACVRARPHARCAVKAGQPRPAKVCLITPRKSHADVDLRHALAPPKKPPGREREDASWYLITARCCSHAALSRFCHGNNLGSASTERGDYNICEKASFAIIAGVATFISRIDRGYSPNVQIRLQNRAVGLY